MNTKEHQPVLVLANSLAASQDMWRELAQTWGQQYRLVRLDYAGHGEQGPDSLGFHDTLQGMGDEFIQRMDEQGTQAFDFIGLSLGGMLGLDVASRYPKRIKRLVAANCRYWQAPEAQTQWDERIEKVKKEGMAAILAPTLERWFTESFRAENPALMERVGNMILSTSAEGYAAAATAVRNADLRPQVAQIECPVLLITGDEDLAAPAPHLEELQSSIPTTTLTVLTPCAHISSMEHADEFQQLVKQHLEG
jgi:3-oxoadipate enol-lactonase